MVRWGKPVDLWNHLHRNFNGSGWRFIVCSVKCVLSNIPRRVNWNIMQRDSTQNLINKGVVTGLWTIELSQMNDSFFGGYQFGINWFSWIPVQIVFSYMNIFISKLKVFVKCTCQLTRGVCSLLANSATVVIYFHYSTKQYRTYHKKNQIYVCVFSSHRLESDPSDSIITLNKTYWYI